MSQEGRWGSPRGAVVRPLLLFTAGLIASFALWRVLMDDPLPTGTGPAPRLTSLAAP